MTKFANKTQVSPEKSRAEIEKLLVKYGASSFMYGWENIHAVISFKMNSRLIRFVLPMPNPKDREFVFKQQNSWCEMKEAEKRERLEQAKRQRWRALVLVVKAKLECVESGITTFENEFMAHIVLPDGSTVGKFMAPQIERAYENGKMPLLLGEAP